MIEVNGDIHPSERGRGARRSVTVRLDGDQGQAQQPNGAGGRGGETLPLRRARLVCSPLIRRHEVRKVCIVVMSSLDEISVNYSEICSLASFHSFQVKIQTFSVVAWSFLS